MFKLNCANKINKIRKTLKLWLFRYFQLTHYQINPQSLFNQSPLQMGINSFVEISYQKNILLQYFKRVLSITDAVSCSEAIKKGNLATIMAV